jgi:hypothetical protein
MSEPESVEQTAIHGSRFVEQIVNSTIGQQLVTSVIRKQTLTIEPETAKALVDLMVAQARMNDQAEGVEKHLEAQIDKARKRAFWVNVLLWTLAGYVASDIVDMFL